MNKTIKKVISFLERKQSDVEDTLKTNSVIGHNQYMDNYLDNEDHYLSILINVLNGNIKGVWIDNYDELEKIFLLEDNQRLSYYEMGCAINEIMNQNIEALQKSPLEKVAYRLSIKKIMLKESPSILEADESSIDKSFTEIYVNRKKCHLIANSLKEAEKYVNIYKRIDEYVHRTPHEGENKMEYEITKESVYADASDEFLDNLKEIGLTDILANSYIMYLVENEKKQQKQPEEPPIIKNDTYKIKPKQIKPKEVSKRELKQKLSELYHEEENEAYFDFKDSKELFTVVRDLNMPDEKSKEILCGITRCAIKNQAYYDYLVEKVKYLNQTNRYKGRFTSTLSDIEEYRQLYEVVDEEAREEIKQELLNLYTGLEFIFVESDALGKILEFEMKG